VYVRQVFDDMASSFDDHLLGTLDYRAPGLLCDAVAAALPPPAATLDVLDAGCGTGLCAPLLRPYARRLIGVDLSAGMLAKAAGRQAYDELVRAELTDFVSHQVDAFDVIASADTLCYFGALEGIFRAAATALRTAGLLAFTLEDAGDATSSWRLTTHGRYCHAWSYVEQCLGGAGLVVHSISAAILRMEGGQPVKGLLVVARKHAAA
jgi:predicted TPR repeat methyltransferase